MNNRQQSSILISIVVIVLLLNIVVLSTKSSIESKRELYQQFEKDAQELIALKKFKRYSSKGLQRIKAVKKPTKESSKRGSVVLNFEDLSQYDLSRLIKAIQGSSLNIEKFGITTNDTNRANLTLEVLK
jgi:hypothetical protein